MIFWKTTYSLNRPLSIIILYFVLPFSTPGSVNENTDNIPNIQLNPKVSYYCLQDYARFLPIRDDYLSAGDAWQKRGQFLKWENFEITHNEKEIWICFSIANHNRQHENFYLNGQMTDYVELYQIKNQKPALITTSGYLVPFAERPILDWGLIIGDEVAERSEQRYLLRLKSVTRNSRHLMDYTILDCMKLYSQDGYEHTYKLRRRLTYFFLGAIFIMFIYNLSISIFTLYREYFLFSIYNIATVLTCLFLTDAHLETGILPIWGWFRNLEYIFFSLIPLTYCWFSVRYLDMETHLPRSYKVLKWMSWIYPVAFIHIILSYFSTAFFLVTISSSVLLALVLYASVRLSINVLSARFLLVGNIFVSIIGILQVINLLEWVTTSQMILSSLVLQMIEITIFSFAVAFKLKVSKRAIHEIRHQNELQQERLRMEENMRVQLEFENNQKARSLTATSIQLLSLNEKLTDIIGKIDQSHDFNRKVIKELDELRQFEHQWDTIKTHFENVHPNFFEKIERSFPNLSPNDHKLLAFLKMKLSNKEIAIILNVTRRAVEQSKRRLKKKLEMACDDLDILGYIDRCVGEV